MKNYTPADEKKFEELLNNMTESEALQILKTIPQHKGNTTFAHCVHVTQMSFKLARMFGIEIDPASLVRGAMLHDYYLYDTKTMEISDYQHALFHPQLALYYASQLFNLNEKEQNIILSHMWPIPGAPLPKSKEAWLVIIADKICACQEMSAGRKAQEAEA